MTIHAMFHFQTKGLFAPLYVTMQDAILGSSLTAVFLVFHNLHSWHKIPDVIKLTLQAEPQPSHFHQIGL